MIAVLGSVVDHETRCIHYHSPLDVVAIRHRCCNDYYPCHLCHEEHAGHPAVPWPVAERDTPAVLCGACRAELTIGEYLATDDCPRCGAAYNPGCRLHSDLYFEPDGWAERTEQPATVA